MTRLVAFLRGVNLGSRHVLPMADVRAVFGAERATDVATMLNSGNVVFTHSARAGTALEQRLARALEEHAGFVVPVMLRTPAQLQAVLDGNPFPKAPTKQVHVTFLAKKPAASAVAAIGDGGCAPEAFVVAGREVYLFLPNGMGKAKLPSKLDALRTPSTTRTWQTVTKLLTMARG